MFKKNKSFLKWIHSRPYGRAHLASTSDEFEYADYLEWCDVNGVEPRGEESDHFYQWCQEEALTYYSEDLAQLKASRHLQGPVVVTGRVGRWNGAFDIVPEVFDSFAVAWAKMMGRDTLDVDVTYDTQCIHVTGRHHDASNFFDVWIVKDSADTEAIQRRIDEGKFDPLCAYDKRFLQTITDYLY